MEGDGQSAQHNGREHGEGKQRADGLLHLLMLFRAHLLGQKNLAAGAEARTDKRQKIHQPPAGGNCRQSGRAHKVPHHGHIHQIIDRLQQVRQHKRKCEIQELPRHRALGQVIDKGLLGRHIHSPSNN